MTSSMFNKIGYGFYAFGVDRTVAVFNCQPYVIRIWWTCEFLRRSGINSACDFRCGMDIIWMLEMYAAEVPVRHCVL